MVLIKTSDFIFVMFTTDTSLGDMHSKDRELLTKLLFARAEVAENTPAFKPNYITVAKIYDIDEYERRRFQTVKDVIDHIANTDSSHPTVADFLKKVHDNGECLKVLGHLVNQILERERKKERNS